jgi:DNA-binding transcriptional ArsR family regulator
MLNNPQALFARNAYARSLLSMENESSGGSRIVVKATVRAGQRGKSIEEVVGYALSHRIRVYVLTLLNEGVYTPDQLARLIGEPTNKVSHHVKELLEAGSIELAKVEKVRNADQHYYRAVEMPFYSDELAEEMTPQQRKVTAGLTLQCMIAEAMSAFWAGKLHKDPRVWLAWRWFNVDAQGRQDIADEQQRSWERMQEIEVESTNRRAQSGEEAASIVVADMGFERERSAPRPPATGANAE